MSGWGFPGAGSPDPCAGRARPAASSSRRARTSAPTEESTPILATPAWAMLSASAGPNAAAHSNGSIGRGADIPQLVTAASRGPQQPRADTRLEPLNLLKVAHQAPPTHT